MEEIVPAGTPVPDPSEAMTRVVAGWEKFLNDLPLIFTRVAAAALLALLGMLVLRWGRRLIRRGYERADQKKNCPISGQTQTIRTLFLSLFNYALYFAIAMTVLSVLGVNVSSLLTVAGVGGVAIGFGCQTLVKDFISGLFLWIEGRFQVGDVITVGGQTGTVESMALRTTTLRGSNGNLFVIPNGDIRTVINMTRDYRNALVDITVAHGQDYARVLALLQDAMEELDQRLEIAQEPPQVLGVIASDGRAATVRIECKCEVGDGWALEREIRLAALKCFEKEGIKP